MRLACWLAALNCLLAAADVGAAPPEKPNILLIVADDLGWADVGWHGGKFATPAMDKLVKEGVELDRHYVQPVCSPTRTALMSGRWTSRWGPHVLSPTNLRAFPAGTTTLAGALKECGYETSISGKWHLGSKAEWGPNHYGFDHSYGSMSGAVDPWTHQYRKGVYQFTWHRDLKVIEEDGNATELVAAEAVKRIRESKKPWFVYVPFQAVHIPVDAPEQYKKMYADTKFHDDPAKNESQQRFAAFVTQMDAKIGEMVKAVEESGQRGNTLIVFTSDNGGLQGGGNAYVSQVAPTPLLSSNLPLRGQKGQLYEGGVRVCAFANWPGVLKPAKSEAPMHAADWMPTLTKLAGWGRGGEMKFDGLDMWGVLSGEQKASPRTIYIPAAGGAAVLRDGWKLIVRGKGEKETTELYNVTKDPSEKEELSKSEAGKVAEMKGILEELRKGDLKGLPEDLKGTPG